MNGVDRVLVGVAVALSPAGHRAARREQWLADVRDAPELELSPTALAFGALTTALLHRRADRRSTWGDTMTAAPLHVRPAPHTIATVPVLLVLALSSFAAAGVGLALLQRYNGLPGAVVLFRLDALAMSVVPGGFVALALLLVAGVGLRRRVLGAVGTLAISVLWWQIVIGRFSLPVEYFLQIGVFAAAVLGVWLAVRRGVGWGWSLVTLPLVAGMLLVPLSSAVQTIDMTVSGWTAVWHGLQLVPFLVAVLAGAVAGRFSTGAPVRFEAHGEPLVDKTV
ncbi:MULTISPECIES: hypothetical protein [unclassified Curtobacterium]|uniref:hypothetical protein n=2 Tax=Curtobacterium TaxID=2034 RepID=UPI003A804BD9